jgi:hypothetical protein
MKTVFRPVAAAAALLCFAGCSSPTSSTNYFDVSYTANPDPATASESTGVQYKVTNADSTVSYYSYAYRSHFDVSIQEKAGYALDITAINLTLQQATGGIVITPSGGDQVYFKFTSQAVTNHINAKGTAVVGFDVWYSLPSGGKEALATVGFSFSYTDSSDNISTYSSSDNVKIAP